MEKTCSKAPIRSRHFAGIHLRSFAGRRARAALGRVPGLGDSLAVSCLLGGHQNLLKTINKMLSKKTDNWIIMEHKILHPSFSWIFLDAFSNRLSHANWHRWRPRWSSRPGASLSARRAPGLPAPCECTASAANGWSAGRSLRALGDGTGLNKLKAENLDRTWINVWCLRCWLLQRSIDVKRLNFEWILMRSIWNPKLPELWS